ncbi:MAG: 50S ribosomal protein L11 methyltransferase [Bacteroidota bacterium]
MAYLEFNFTIVPLFPASEIVMAELGEIGFESFVETENGLLAYIKKTDYGGIGFDGLHILKNPDVQIAWTIKELEQQNWNAVWEKNFEPIKVGGECLVRAPFHPAQHTKYDIVIEPKMSFGTGHHETTYMMIQTLLGLDLKGKSVLDMGCGTGVLAILSEKKGAMHIDAIDIDRWCFLNSQENVERNHCRGIHIFEGDASLLGIKVYDVILANINRNILLDDIPKYSKCLHQKGTLVLSGFYEDDLSLISSRCETHGLTYHDHKVKNNWVAAVYRFS